MKYKNIKTGFVFETQAKIEGADWVLVEEAKKQDEPKKAEKPKTKKKAK